MKTQILTFLFSLVLIVQLILVNSPAVFAQYNDNWKSADNHTNGYRPNNFPKFTKKQNDWLLKNDFSIALYKWDNPEINKYIRSSIHMRTGSKVFETLGVLLGVTGLYGIIFHGVIDDPDSRDSFKKDASNLLIASGLLITTSISFSIGARNNIKKAKKLQYKSLNIKP